jgi:hypothetical protein
MTVAPYLTTTEAALAAGVTPAAIRQWARRGKLRRYGSRNRALWRADEILNATRRRPHLRRGLTMCHDPRKTTGSVP